jgi:hypothetical protein
MLRWPRLILSERRDRRARSLGRARSQTNRFARPRDDASGRATDVAAVSVLRNMRHAVASVTLLRM